MTTDDFREKVERLGFNPYRGNNTISIERSGVVIASVSIDKWARYDFSSRRIISAEKMPQLTKFLAEYGETPVEDREEAYYRMWIPALSKKRRAYIHGTSSDPAVIAFTNDKNLADKVSERGAKDVTLLMDRIHNIKVEKERV
ncbi:MAG: hypothetical protein HXK06_00040 [Actinomyces graevenitzii]|nr:hypothetical protein [Actinomyces graevenitzii]